MNVWSSAPGFVGSANTASLKRPNPWSSSAPSQVGASGSPGSEETPGVGEAVQWPATVSVRSTLHAFLNSKKKSLGG